MSHATILREEANAVRDLAAKIDINHTAPNAKNLEVKAAEAVRYLRAARHIMERLPAEGALAAAAGTAG